MGPPPRPIPQAVLDRLAFHEAAALEGRAEVLEAKGKDGSPFRRHIMRSLGLTQAQLPTFIVIAVQFTAEDRAAVAKYAPAMKAWRDEYFPEGRLRAGLAAPPAPPAAVNELLADRRAVLGKYRQLLRSTFGDAVTTQIEETIAKHVQVNLLAAKAAAEAKGGAR